jgi:hypothetical protein
MVHIPAVTLKYGVGIVWDLGFMSLFLTYNTWRNVYTSIELHSTAVGFFFSKLSKLIQKFIIHINVKVFFA